MPDIQVSSDIHTFMQATDAAAARAALGAAAATHAHAIADVTNLQTTLNGKAATSHSHVISDVSGLQTALDGKQATGSYASAVHTHAIADVTGLQTALDGKQAAGSYATLVGGVIPSAQLPSYVDDVLEYAAPANFPATGEAGKIYVATTTGKTYRWSGSSYTEISASPGSTDSVPEGSVNLYFTTARAASAAPVQTVNGQTGAVTITAASISAAAVGHTHVISDVTGLQTALDGKQATGSYAATTHTHAISDVSGLQTALDGKVSKAGDTMTGKLNLPAAAATAPLNITPSGLQPTTVLSGDIWIRNNLIQYRGSSATVNSVVATAEPNTFTTNQTISPTGASTPTALAVTQNASNPNGALTVDLNNTASTATAVRITNQGTGASLVVEDQASVDPTPFTVSNTGKVGVGVAPDANIALSVDTSGIKFGDGTVQTTAGGAGGVSSFSAGATGLTPATGTTGAVVLAGTLAIANGGTGQTTAANAINALVPSQSGQSGKVLTTNGSVVSWGAAGGGGGITALTGDVTASGTGSVTATVARLRGIPLSANTPINNQILQYNATAQEWQPSASAAGAITMVAFTTVGYQSGVSLPAGYAWADIYVCSGAGGGGGGMDCMNGNNGGAAYGGGGGGAGLSEFLQKIPIDGATFEFEIGAGGAGGIGHSTYTGQAGTDGGDGMPTYLKMNRQGVNMTLSDLGKYAEPATLNSTGGQAGNLGGGAGYCTPSFPAIWRSTLTQGGSGTYGAGNASVYTGHNNVGRPISVGGSSGAGISTTPNDGGPITNIKFPNLDYTTNTLFQYQGKATSGAQDALPLPTLALGSVDFNSLNFLGGAGGASADYYLNSPMPSPIAGYRAGNGADGQLGCGGGGGGAIGGSYSDASNPYYGGDGGDGGQGYIIFICYN